jgi:hypothetical protein
VTLLLGRHLAFTMKAGLPSTSCLLVLALFCLPPTSQAETEEERVVEHYKRNYTWPPTKFIPDNPGWKKLMQHRIRQVEESEGWQERFDGFPETLSAAIVQRNFTEHGFALARAPEDLMEVLREGIRKGVAAGPRLEVKNKLLGGIQPWFIDRPDLARRVRNQ